MLCISHHTSHCSRGDSGASLQLAWEHVRIMPPQALLQEHWKSQGGVWFTPEKNGHIRNWTVRLPCFAQDELHYYRRCFLLFKEGPPKPFSLWPSFCFSSHSNGNTRFALDEEPMSHAPLPQTSDLLQKKNISGGLRFLTALAPCQHNYQLIDRSTAHVCNNLLSKF